VVFTGGMWPFWGRSETYIKGNLKNHIFLQRNFLLLSFPTHPFSLSSLCVVISQDVCHTILLSGEKKTSSLHATFVEFLDLPFCRFSLKGASPLNPFEAKHDLIVEKENGRKSPRK